MTRNNVDSKLKRELLDFLEDLPIIPENFKSNCSFFGRQHTETLFRRMLNDREFLQLLIWESIAPKTVDLSNFSCLFSRYTCFKFFERYANVPFWYCRHLMGIPEDETINFWAIADVRHIFGCEILENLFKQLKSCRPNFNLRDLNDLCIKFNTDHRQLRSDKLNADAKLEISKRNLIHFDDVSKNAPQDYGLLDCKASTITYIDPISGNGSSNVECPSIDNDDGDLSQQLAECFKQEDDEDDDGAPAVAAGDGSEVKKEPVETKTYMGSRLDSLKKAREAKAAKLKRKLSMPPQFKKEPILEMPAFSVDDLEKFSDEDPYVSYALAFACCDKRLSRMNRVKNVLEKELENIGSSTKKRKLTHEQEALKKLRHLASVFAPKRSKYNTQFIQNMSDEQLLDLNLTDFARACEAEFTKVKFFMIMDDSKKNLKEKFRMQILRYQKLLLKMMRIYQPENEIFSLKEDQPLGIVNFERGIHKYLRVKKQEQSKIECLIDLNENIVDVKMEEPENTGPVVSSVNDGQENL